MNYTIVGDHEREGMAHENLTQNPALILISPNNDGAALKLNRPKMLSKSCYAILRTEFLLTD